jgi:hypothetical protein
MPKGWTGISVTEEAKDAADTIVVLMTTRHQKRFTYSEALIQAAKDLRLCKCHT